jgi:hypothetical protein
MTRVMATLLLYAYAVGERSSRAIERRCREDVAFHVAACGLAPDHVTIARFRRRHADALVGLFAGVLALCAEAALVRVGRLAIDGTRIHANANKDRVCVEDPLAGEARRMLAEAEAEDEREDELPADEQAARRGLLPAGFDSEQERRAVARAEETLASAGAEESVGVYLADGGHWSGGAVDELEAGGRRLLVKPNGRPRTRGLPASGGVAGMERRLARAPNKKRYRRWQALVEPVIAQVKRLRRLDRLLLRALPGAEVEWTLASAAHNLTRLARLRAAA